MTIFALQDAPISQQIAAVERGIPSSFLRSLASTTGLSEQRILRGLDLSQRTITARKKAGARFSAVESERILRVVRIYRTASKVFTTRLAISEWLAAPDRSLGSKSPLEMLRTDLGTAKVENLVRAMIHGVPA